MTTQHVTKIETQAGITTAGRRSLSRRGQANTSGKTATSNNTPFPHPSLPSSESGKTPTHKTRKGEETKKARCRNGLNITGRNCRRGTKNLSFVVATGKKRPPPPSPPTRSRENRSREPGRGNIPQTEAPSALLAPPLDGIPSQEGYSAINAQTCLWPSRSQLDHAIMHERCDSKPAVFLLACLVELRMLSTRGSRQLADPPHLKTLNTGPSRHPVERDAGPARLSYGLCSSQKEKRQTRATVAKNTGIMCNFFGDYRHIILLPANPMICQS